MGVQAQKITMTIIMFILIIFLQRSGLAYINFLNLVEAIIRHKKLRLNCGALVRRCTSYKELLPVIFALNRKECFIEFKT